MATKLVCCFCVVTLLTCINAFILQEGNETEPDIAELFKKTIDEFRKCIDQMLATTVDVLDTKQLQPVFQAVGDKINRVNKAFQDLTAPNP